MPASTPGIDWTTYLDHSTRDARTLETTLSAGDVANLTVRWTYTTGGVVVTNPIVAQGRVYVGSWDGFEYALDSGNGSRLWRAFLGQTVSCGVTQGVSSTTTFLGNRLHVGGGADERYSLDAANGSILWSVRTGSTASTGPNAGHYDWASPLIDRGLAYVGLASACDRPLVRGGLLEVNLTTHQVVRTFWTTPNGTLGASIWSSPTLDRQRGIV